MKYSGLNCLNLNSNKLKQHLFYNVLRSASTGLGLWDLNVDNEIRHKIEDHWKDKIWSSKIKGNDSDKEKYYVLSMFPYPSGSLHMGHVRVYSISDAVSRFHRMKGKNVVHPMGWDAFGLPAENAAIERNIDPKEWTDSNIKNMKEQLNILGCDFDWEREFATCNPNYYRWTQELFLKLYDCGLAYQKKAFVNWDPVDKTVLADEQVDHDGKSWRSGAKVEKKLLRQWFIRTTALAKSLFDGLDDPMLKEWRDIIKIQKHWIGDCNGTSMDFKLVFDSPDDADKPDTFNIWTDKPEFIEHAKFVSVSRDNFLAKSQIDNFTDITTKYLNAKVINPFNNEELPIYYTDTMKFSKLRDNHIGIPGCFQADADFCIDNGITFDKIEELSNEEIENKRKIVMERAKELRIGGYLVSATLRDWLISRQRYWGAPIPIINCDKCGSVPVPRDQLPVLLPEKSSSSDSGIPNLRQATDWLKTSCPNCGDDATREADTMDTFVDSSWYFMRFIDPHNDNEMFSHDKAMKYLPVDLYIGGKEHAALHLYYARFINHFLFTQGLLPTREPFKQLLVQGMVMGKSFRVKGSGKYLKEHEVEKQGNNFIEKNSKLPVVVAWEKMSKSKYNGVDPMEMFKEYGSDTTRLIILADVAPTSSRNWSDQTFPGIFNWQQRLWLSIRQLLISRNGIDVEEIKNTIPDTEKFITENEYLFNSRNYYIKGVTFNIIGSQQLSVGISKMQGLTNSLRKVSLKCLTHSSEYERTLATQIIMLAPLAPRFASELWSGFCSAPYHLVNDDLFIQRDKDVLEQKWPEVDSNYELDIDVIVNGAHIDTLKIPKCNIEKMSGENVAELALQSEAAKKYIKDRKIIGFKYHWDPDCDGKIQFQVSLKPSNLKIKTTVL
ncbi:leucine--tRNA ligase, mitochondrial isoform X1 [Microplitis demolitor]|uniref:leucine--tRNA ligase, mitochondrial isoform X1 n=2 Tax=Microplitis demolitor TaxID=69319 RepID=UPI00235B6850|nr:leucine--tRNA ligase, mitochondrial isoform X1 [Microplitis demolitor]